MNRALPENERMEGKYVFIGDELSKSSLDWLVPAYPFFEGMVVKVRVVQATTESQRFRIACTVKDAQGKVHQARSKPFYVSAARSVSGRKRKRKLKQDLKQNLNARRAQAQAKKLHTKGTSPNRASCASRAAKKIEQQQ